MKTIICAFLCITLFPSFLFSQNLISNPSCEQIPTNGWIQELGSWDQATMVTPQHGDYHFYANNSNDSSTLTQNVDVSLYATSIDIGGQIFLFSGYIRDLNGNDESRIQINYLNSLGQELFTYDTGWISRWPWQLLTHTKIAPPLTRTIQIKLMAKKNSGITNDGYFDNLQLIPYLPLPISLASFDAQTLSDQTVKLSWTTESEEDTEYFTLQKSLNVKDWISIDSIDAAGQSFSTIHYHTIDNHPTIGNNYYRLITSDYSSFKDTSHIIIHELIHTTKDLSIYPNPSSELLFYRIHEYPLPTNIRSVKIYNTLQELLHQSNLDNPSMNAGHIDISLLSSGIYWLEITDSFDHKWVKKFVKI